LEKVFIIMDILVGTVFTAVLSSTLETTKNRSYWYEGVLMPIMAGTKNKQLRSFASKSARLQAAPLVCKPLRSSASRSARLQASRFVCQQVGSYAIVLQYQLHFNNTSKKSML
jgi:hypothetical protein